MASTNKTPRLGLSQWEASDAFSREDLNADLLRVDEAASGTRVKLFEAVVQQQVTTMQIVLPDFEMSDYAELIVSLDCRGRDLCIRVNGNTSDYRYYLEPDSMKSDTRIPVRNAVSRFSLMGNRLIHRNDMLFRCDIVDPLEKINTMELYTEKDKTGYYIYEGDHITVWGVRR